MNQLDKALEVVQQAVSIAPDASQVYLIRGGIYEAMGRLPDAVDDYNRSASLAQEHGEDTIYVLAKTRMGMLLQSGAGFQPTGTPGP